MAVHHLRTYFCVQFLLTFFVCFPNIILNFDAIFYIFGLIKIDSLVKFEGFGTSKVKGFQKIRFWFVCLNSIKAEAESFKADSFERSKLRLSV